MPINKTRDEKLQYDINKEAAKMSALWSGKIDKYEYLTSEEILAMKEEWYKLRLQILHHKNL